MSSGAWETRRLRRWLGAMALGFGLGLGLVACGGGTSQYEPFQPTRLYAFGDEASLLLPDGRKYTVNAVNATTGALDCAGQPVWVQGLAAIYGFVFAECNPAAVAAPQGRMRAALGAKVADLAGQIDVEMSRGGYSATDLATVMLGVNDVLELYAQFPQRSEAALIDDARARGTQLAQQINRLVGMGPRVIVATIPDMGFSPYALAQKALFTDTDRAALISRLSAALNARMRVEVLNDGRFVGLVLGDEMVQAMARSPGSFGLLNASTAVCTTTLPGCTSQTLVTNGNATNWLWADDRRMSFGGHQRLAIQAEARARNNPF